MAVDRFDIITRYGRVGNKAHENRKSFRSQVAVQRRNMMDRCED
ncbi:hypothetical protein [Psychroflexus sp. MES1-P1E]|nr:hypothetical protein CXF67_15715 [Psychroflexus sp. MES1-P1E]